MIGSSAELSDNTSFSYAFPGKQILENGFLPFCGVLSYGLYTYHPMVIHIVVYWWLPDYPPLGKTSMTLLVSFCCAYLSFRFLEKPFLSLNKHFQYV